MKRDREDVARMGVPELHRTSIQAGRRSRRQRIVGTTRAGKNGRCPVALMNIAIDGHGGANLVVTLHAADGDSNVVNHAEALAMVGEGVVKSAADVETDA